MKCNLLKIKELFHEMWSCNCGHAYSQLNEVLSRKNICYHLTEGTLYFIGDINAVIEAGLVTSVDECTSVPIEQETSDQLWGVIRVLLYKAMSRFLWEKGLRRNKNVKGRNRVFIAQQKTHNFTTLIYDYSSPDRPGFVHEGFDYSLKKYGDDIYLCIMPAVTVTTDSISCIEPTVLSREKFKEYKTNFIDKRYNSKLRSILECMIEILSNSGPEIDISSTGWQIKIEKELTEVRYHV